MSKNRPNLKELAGRLLDRDMDAWLLEQKADERTDDWIARKIAEETNGVITPTDSTVWMWRRDLRLKNDVTETADEAAS